MSILTTRRASYFGLAILALVLLYTTTVLAGPYGSRSLYTGTVGGDVLELQRRLASLGFGPGMTDGIFGPRTRSAVMEFQREYGMVPDGMAGKWTFRAVDRAYTWQNGSDYTSISGDSLWLIAQRHALTVEEIMDLNQMHENRLFPGQVVRLPVQLAPPPVVAEPPASPVPGATPRVPASSDAPGGATTETGDLPAPPTEPAPSYTVLGYYAEDWETDMRALNSLRGAGNQVDMVVNFQLLIHADGKITTREYPGLMAQAKAKGIPVHGLVHNFMGTSFDSNVARSVLSSPENRARVAQNMLQVARQQGLAGINIDIESVPPDQRHNYTALIRELADTLKPEGLMLTLSIPAKTWDDPKNGWSGAFDYKALGQYADYIVPMAYDETLPGFPAGPVASYDWVEKVATYSASTIPPQKVLLGIAAYGYDWRKGTTEARGASVPQALKRAAETGAAIQWDAKARVPFYTYWSQGQERIVYFENAESLKPKLDLVKQYGLGGIGIWRLGLEEPAIWDVIQSNLR